MEGRPLTRQALEWARELHAGQVREVDRAEFILHPLGVAALRSGRGFDNEVVAAGLLHDAVEDTDVRIDDIAVLVALFAETGSYASAQESAKGSAPAMGAGAALSLGLTLSSQRGRVEVAAAAVD